MIVKFLKVDDVVSEGRMLDRGVVEDKMLMTERLSMMSVTRAIRQQSCEKHVKKYHSPRTPVAGRASAFWLSSFNP